MNILSVLLLLLSGFISHALGLGSSPANTQAGTLPPVQTTDATPSNIDSGTPVPLGTLPPERFFAQNSDSIYCSDGYGGYKPIPGSDPKTFWVLAFLNYTTDSDGASLLLEKDKNHVYVGCSVVPIVDAETFSLIYNASDEFTGYAKDRNYIYFADPSGFDYDDSHQFGPGSLTQISTDTTDFVILNGWDPKGLKAPTLSQSGSAYPQYAEDSKHVYYERTPIASADVKSFKVVPGGEYGEAFGEDKTNVYFRDGVIQGLDPNGLIPLGWSYSKTGGYVKDQGQIFYIFVDANQWMSQLLGSVAPTSFEVSTSSPGVFDAQDASHTYLNGLMQ